jgi:prolipoprotein diacylglyceryltransferase
MYPNLQFALQDLFNINVPGLRFINSFGLFVAIAFLVGAWFLARELRRKSRQGFFQPTEMKITVGKPAGTADLMINFLLGFLLGYKILALFFLSSEATQNPQAFIFSSMGSWPLGLILGSLFAFLKWREKAKHKLERPEERMVRLWPEDRVGEFTIIALIFGLVGAKMFDIFENWEAFKLRPADYIFSGGGLTFYGGLILATLAIIWYARKHRISLRHLADSIAPALMIAYAIGRIGCQVAGDGDWGIFNSAYASTPDGQVVAAQPGQFVQTVSINNAFFSEYVAQSGADSVQHTSVTKPSALGFLPDWMFAYNYPHNVNSVGVKLPGCTGEYCSQLPVPAFPTPFYETLACLLLFGVLWALRTKMRIPGTLFALYLILNGLERFFIEKIRVNNRMNSLPFNPTQAEVISLGLVFVGIILWIFLRQKYQASPRKV